MKAPLYYWLSGLFAWMVVSSAASSGAASTVRYALIVGNDYGNGAPMPLEKLKHAEREAHEIEETLIEFGNFLPENVILLTGRGKKDILAAARGLARRHRRDREALGDLPTLFAFFFTGHGLSGKLLTKDDALSGKDISDIFSMMDASLTVGFVDACFSEGLDLDILTEKGVVSTPGLNPFSSLPKEVLMTVGNIWLLSSRPEEHSYEHREFGGLFTHYFLESFTRAGTDNVGVTLDAMWEYARKNTETYASSFGKQQTPVKIVRRLKSVGPLYFSFPNKKSATIRFAKDVEGAYLLLSQGGTIMEKVTKKRGEPLDISFYPGEVGIREVAEKETPGMSYQFLLKPDAIVTIGANALHETPDPSFGYWQSPMAAKGELLDTVLTERKPHSEWEPHVSYTFIPKMKEGVVYPVHRLGIGATLAHGYLSFSLNGGWGTETQNHGGWGYRLHAATLRGLLGAGWQKWMLRLDVDSGAEMLYLRQNYTDGETRNLWGLWLGGSVRGGYAIPTSRPVYLAVRVGLGAQYAPPVAIRSVKQIWSIAPLVEVSAGMLY